MKTIFKETRDGRKIFKDMGMNKWREVSMEKIKKGDRFRLYTPNGRPMELGGEETFVAQSDAYLDGDIWVVEVKAKLG
ncbi:hypothetical protein DSCO28_26220 [Desulfosarcina ovata subsp. sediminis]|uniref:Uncharacterized protein n=1 Tax=Desulfosarcina ovata subsp. sediminis TaxID=885957 RepID=A0A5K7ZLR9_9BACT|nr:hypothetical protein [Desulfosarcina ovata]BBO82056.1 hypothetical protein DSCO28_26220 [Desulfosarcina ovata subsp. sediminis]